MAKLSLIAALVLHDIKDINKLNVSGTLAQRFEDIEKFKPATYESLIKDIEIANKYLKKDKQ